MTAYTALYPDMIVHKAGCSDIAKTPNLHPDTTVTAEAENLDAFLAAELSRDLGDMGYTADDYDVKPCAAKGR